MTISEYVTGRIFIHPSPACCSLHTVSGKLLTIGDITSLIKDIIPHLLSFKFQFNLTSSLFAATYSLSAPTVSLSAASSSLSAATSSLSAATSSLSAATFSLSAANYSLCSAVFSLSAATYSLSAATIIRTRREFKCLPYGGFFFLNMFFL